MNTCLADKNPEFAKHDSGSGIFLLDRSRRFQTAEREVCLENIAPFSPSLTVVKIVCNKGLYHQYRAQLPSIKPKEEVVG